MHPLLIWVARIAGIVGVGVTIVAIVTRLSGAYWLAGFQVGTLLQAGMAALLLACLGYVAALAERRTQ